jgi:polysaccharide biosynthesis transport protein
MQRVIMEYFQIIWKRRWYALGVFILAVSGSAIYAALISDMYKSETRVVIEDLVRPDEFPAPGSRINSIRQLLSSRTFLEKMIEQLQMYGYGTRSDFVMEDTVKTAQKHIGIEETSRSTYIISFTASDPRLAQQVARHLGEELIGELISVRARSRRESMLSTGQFIDEMLRKTSKDLAAQEEKIKQFITTYRGKLPEQGNGIIASLPRLLSLLAAAENSIQQANERQKQLDFKRESRQRGNAPASSEKELAAKKALLLQLLPKYAPNHHTIRALKLDIERLEEHVKNQKAKSGSTTEPFAAGSQTQEEVGEKAKDTNQTDLIETAFAFEESIIKGEISRSEKEKQEIWRQIKLLQSRLKLSPPLEEQFSDLLRELGILQKQFDDIRKKKISIQLAMTTEAEKKDETCRIIDEATLPVKPEFPNRMQIILMGIGGGLLLGIGAAFGREILDATISPAT